MVKATGEVLRAEGEPLTLEEVELSPLAEGVPQMIELYREGKFPFDRLVKTFPFSEINAAIEASESGEVIKPIVVFD